MNQRRPQMPPRGPRPQGPQMPPRGPQSAQDKPEYHYWRKWRRWPHYWRYYDYDYDWYDYDWDWYDYDYDWDWYDWRYYGGDRQQTPARPSKMSYCFKVEPMLMGNLLEYASTTQPSQEDIQGMLDRMVELSNVEDGYILDMEDYDMIVISTTNIKTMSPPNTDKQS